MILLNMSKYKTNSIDFEVNGGKKLSGSITTNFSKKWLSWATLCFPTKPW